MIKLTCNKDIFRIIHGRKQFRIPEQLRTQNFIEKRKWWKYIDGWLSIFFDEAYTQNRKNQLINDISNFNNEHIIQCYSVTISNTHEKPC